MKNGNNRLSRVRSRVSRAVGSSLAWVYRLLSETKFTGFDIYVIPGILALKVNRLAGESGRAHLL